MEKIREIQAAADLLPNIQDVTSCPGHRLPSRTLFWQLARFSVVGVINATVDVSALNILLLFFPTRNADVLLLYNSLAFSLGAVNSYLMNKYWTFRLRQAITGGELFRFATVTVLGFFCNDEIIWMAARLLHSLIANSMLWANASKLSAVLGTAIVSYFGMRLWVFAGRSRERGGSPAPSALAEGPGDDDLAEKRHVGGGPLSGWSLSVVLPAYNEEAVIAATIREVVGAMNVWTDDFEIIVVNDGSRDATGAILDGVASADVRVRVIHHPVNRGYGAALVSGFEAAEKDLTFFMDSDGQFDIRDLEAFFPLIDDYDAVLGYRIDRQDSWMRKLNARGWKTLVGMVLGVRVRDVDCAFKLYRGNFFREHRLETRGAMINAEMIYKFTRAGNTYTQVGVRHLFRRGGRATGAKPAVILRAFRELFVYAHKWRREARGEGEREKRPQTVEV